MDKEIYWYHSQGMSVAVHTTPLTPHVFVQMGKFISDRAIVEYAESYWNIESCAVKA